MADDGDHYHLAFDKPGTWGQKYNLVWDNILGLHLFPPDVSSREISFYLQHMNRYGLPLDNRATYTKLDWELWTATPAGSPDDFRTMVHSVFSFLNDTPDRVPMTDWYDTITSKQVGFQARSVVSGFTSRCSPIRQSGKNGSCNPRRNNSTPSAPCLWPREFFHRNQFWPSGLA